MNWFKEPRFQLKRWGWYLVLLQGTYFKVKFLYFKRGGEISLQKHAWRDETWCFLFGSGWMQNYLNHEAVVKWPIGKGSFQYIPKRNWHHYKADKRTLVLEVQTGRCEEEDIERA